MVFSKNNILDPYLLSMMAISTKYENFMNSWNLDFKMAGISTVLLHDNELFSMSSNFVLWVYKLCKLDTNTVMTYMYNVLDFT